MLWPIQLILLNKFFWWYTWCCFFHYCCILMLDWNSLWFVHFYSLFLDFNIFAMCGVLFFMKMCNCTFLRFVPGHANSCYLGETVSKCYVQCCGVLYCSVLYCTAPYNMAVYFVSSSNVCYIIWRHNRNIRNQNHLCIVSKWNDWLILSGWASSCLSFEFSFICLKPRVSVKFNLYDKSFNIHG